MKMASRSKTRKRHSPRPGTLSQKSEAQIEAGCRDFVVAMGGQMFKLTPSQSNGIPDRLVLLPGGKIMFAELKKPGETPAKLQLYFHRMLRNLGFTVGWYDNQPDFERDVMELIHQG